mmetsp:Transcript_27960/g.53217  ORF Transcript_27960/g.53217 Transcript_27960/m.53217 type:complete len:228 (+) Transcript_27960:1735-2418(+)
MNTRISASKIRFTTSTNFLVRSCISANTSTGSAPCGCLATWHASASPAESSLASETHLDLYKPEVLSRTVSCPLGGSTNSARVPVVDSQKPRNCEASTPCRYGSSMRTPGLGRVRDSNSNHPVCCPAVRHRQTSLVHAARCLRHVFGARTAGLSSWAWFATEGLAAAARSAWAGSVSAGSASMSCGLVVALALTSSPRGTAGALSLGASAGDGDGGEYGDGGDGNGG